MGYSVSPLRGWSFLTNHARALLCIAHNPGARLRNIAAMVGVTERSAHDIVDSSTPATWSKTRLVAATGIASKSICRSGTRSAANAPSARCWAYSSAPTHITGATRRRGPLLADNPPRKPRHGKTHGNSLNETRAAKKLTRETSDVLTAGCGGDAPDSHPRRETHPVRSSVRRCGSRRSRRASHLRCSGCSPTRIRRTSGSLIVVRRP